MKKLFLMAALFIAVSTLAVAQKSTCNKHENKRLGAMKKLNLNEEQKQKIKAINQEAKQKRNALESNDAITLAEYRQKKQEIAQQKKQQVEAVLTANQKAELEKMKQERVAKRQEKMAARLNKLSEQLNLTSAQQNSIATKRQEAFERIKQIKENESLTFAQKQEQLKAIHEEQKNYMKSVLTADQLQKLEALRMAKRKEVKK